MYSYHLLFFPSFFSYLRRAKAGLSNLVSHCWPCSHQSEVRNEYQHSRDIIVTQRYVLLPSYLELWVVGCSHEVQREDRQLRQLAGRQQLRHRLVLKDAAGAGDKHISSQHYALARPARLPGVHELLVEAASRGVCMTLSKRMNYTGHSRCHSHLLSVTTRCSGTRRMTSPSLMSRAATVESMT